MKKACYNKNQNDQHSINIASNQNSTVGLWRNAINRKETMIQNNTKYLSIPQAAEQVGIGIEKMRDLIRKGDIPAVSWGYRTIRID